MPGRSAYRKGAHRERRSAEFLELAGYTVHRIAGSHGEWDLIAIDAVGGLLVQVKSRDWPGTLERQALAEYIAPPNFRKVIHRWRDGAREPEVQRL